MRIVGALAGVSMLCVAAQAYLQDATILIDRALNSPTMTVRYSGAKVAMIELRLNGVSIATRNADARLNSGETNFTVDPKALRDGDNDIEVRAYDVSGKLVGIQNTRVTADRSGDSPAKLLGVKSGATVQGPVEITIGFERDLRNTYVSFFIDDEFKALRNFPPYNYVWDTTRSTNGWHDLEAWIVDETNNTFKTNKTRVFVNNPGGRTERNLANAKPAPVPTTAPNSTEKPAPIVKPAPVAPTELKPSANVAPGVGAGAGVKSSDTQAAVALTNNTAPVAPRPAAITSTAGTQAQASNPSGLKSSPAVPATTTGPKYLVPQGNKVPPAVATQAQPTIVVQNSGGTPASVAMGTAGHLSMVKIGYGQRLPNIGSFTVILNNKVVNFDVMPRVENGIPLTPFRHLFEHAGGKVKWLSAEKSVEAAGVGQKVTFRIGSREATVNDLLVQMEVAPFLEKGRSVVPLSFIKDALKVDVQYDPKTSHVLITSSAKK